MQETQETWVRSLGGEYLLKESTGNPLQYYCLENPMDRGAWLQSTRSQRVRHDWSDLAQHSTAQTHSLNKPLRIEYPMLNRGFPWWLSGKEYPYQCRRPGFDHWVRQISWRRELLPTLVFWPIRHSNLTGHPIFFLTVLSYILSLQ